MPRVMTENISIGAVAERARPFLAVHFNDFMRAPETALAAMAIAVADRGELPALVSALIERAFGDAFAAGVAAGCGELMRMRGEL